MGNLEKVCTACEKIFPLTGFYADRRRLDGHRAMCKNCSEVAVRRWRSEHPEAVAIYQAKWQHSTSAHVKEVKRAKGARLRTFHKDRTKARDAINNAVKRGKIQKKPCEICSNPQAEGHHFLGYAPEHRLDVQWLCRECHRAVHRKAKAS
jgi:hypothetical protein